MDNNDLISTNSNIINVNEETFMSEVVEVSKTKPVIVDFWAPWCEPCKTLTPLLEEAVKRFGKDLILAKIDIDNNESILSVKRTLSNESMKSSSSFKSNKSDGSDFINMNALFGKSPVKVKGNN